MGNGSVVPCAIKRVPYVTSRQQEQAQLELAALHAALGLPNLVHCLAAFMPQKTDTAASLVIVTECAPALLASDDGVPQQGV